MRHNAQKVEIMSNTFSFPDSFSNFYAVKSCKGKLDEASWHLLKSFKSLFKCDLSEAYHDLPINMTICLPFLPLSPQFPYPALLLFAVALTTFQRQYISPIH